MSADPIEVDAGHYKVEFENEKVRVLRIRMGVGEQSEMHGHPDCVSVVLTDGRVRFDYPDGKTREIDIHAGDCEWQTAGDHLPANVGDGPVEVLLVEIKPAN